MCVPGGSGFAEFHNTRDSHTSNTRSSMILAARANRDATPGAAANAAVGEGHVR